MSVMSAGGAAVPLGGAGSEGFSVGSPRRPAEARRRFGADESDDLEERSEERFRARPLRAAVYGEANPAIRKGSYEVSHYYCFCCSNFAIGAVSLLQAAVSIMLVVQGVGLPTRNSLIRVLVRMMRTTRNMSKASNVCWYTRRHVSHGRDSSFVPCVLRTGTAVHLPCCTSYFSIETLFCLVACL